MRTPMSTAWSLFSTAGHIDVLESILDLLDWKSLLACSATTRHLNELICQSPRYQLRLRAAYHQDPSINSTCPSLSSSERLERVIDIEQRWSEARPRSLDLFTFKSYGLCTASDGIMVHVPEPDMDQDDFAPEFERDDDDIHPNSWSVFVLDNLRDGIGIEDVPRTDFVAPFPVHDVICSREDNLLVATTRVVSRMDDHSEAVFSRIYCYELLSAGPRPVRHPEAQQPYIDVKWGDLPEGDEVDDYEIDVQFAQSDSGFVWVVVPGGRVMCDWRAGKCTWHFGGPNIMYLDMFPADPTWVLVCGLAVRDESPIAKRSPELARRIVPTLTVVRQTGTLDEEGLIWQSNEDIISSETGLCLGEFVRGSASSVISMSVTGHTSSIIVVKLTMWTGVKHTAAIDMPALRRRIDLSVRTGGPSHLQIQDCLDIVDWQTWNEPREHIQPNLPLQPSRLHVEAEGGRSIISNHKPLAWRDDTDEARTVHDDRLSFSVTDRADPTHPRQANPAFYKFQSTHLYVNDYRHRRNKTTTGHVSRSTSAHPWPLGSRRVHDRKESWSLSSSTLVPVWDKTKQFKVWGLEWSHGGPVETLETLRQTPNTVVPFEESHANPFHLYEKVFRMPNRGLHLVLKTPLRVDDRLRKVKWAWQTANAVVVGYQHCIVVISF